MKAPRSEWTALTRLMVPPGAVLGVVGLVRGDLEFREDADVDGRPVGRDDGAGRDAVPQHVHGAPSRQGAPPRDLEKRLVRVVTPVMTQIRSRDSPRLCTCLPRCREGRGIANEPFVWLPLNDSGK